MGGGGPGAGSSPPVRLVEEEEEKSASSAAALARARRAAVWGGRGGRFDAREAWGLKARSRARAPAALRLARERSRCVRREAVGAMRRALTPREPTSSSMLFARDSTERWLRAHAASSSARRPR